MQTLSNNEVRDILSHHHTGMLLLMPGSPDVCAGQSIIATKQKFQFGMNGCHRCMMYSLRELMEREPDFKQVVVDALNANYNP